MPLKTTFGITLLLVLFFTNTAIIYGTGGPGEMLVFKPLHGIHPFYGGGEEGSWIRKHPDQPLPWWHYPLTDYRILYQTSYETTIAPWTVAYRLAYALCIVMVAFCSLKLLLVGLRRYRSRPASQPASQPH